MPCHHGDARDHSRVPRCPQVPTPPLPAFPTAEEEDANDADGAEAEPDTRALVRAQNQKKKKSGGFQSMGTCGGVTAVLGWGPYPHLSPSPQASATPSSKAS